MADLQRDSGRMADSQRTRHRRAGWTTGSFRSRNKPATIPPYCVWIALLTIAQRTLQAEVANNSASEHRRSRSLSASSTRRSLGGKASHWSNSSCSYHWLMNVHHWWRCG